MGDHWIVSGGRGCTAAAGLGVCVAPCLQTFQTKPDTSAARGRLCGRGVGVRQGPQLWARGGMTFYVSAARPVWAVVGDDDTISLFRRKEDEWLRIRCAVFGLWPADLSVAVCGGHVIRLNHLRLQSDSRREE